MPKSGGQSTPRGFSHESIVPRRIVDRLHRGRRGDGARLPAAETEAGSVGAFADPRGGQHHRLAPRGEQAPPAEDGGDGEVQARSSRSREEGSKAGGGREAGAGDPRSLRETFG